MGKSKATVDFTCYSSPELLPVAGNIHAEMTANAVVFVSPPVNMTLLVNAIADYEAKLAANASRAKYDFAAIEVSRFALEGNLSTLGNYVNQMARGDAKIVTQSGFPSCDTTRTLDPNPPAALIDLVLRQGDLSGTLVARYRPQREGSINEVQTNVGDPNAEASWAPAGMFNGGRARLDGFAPGTFVWCGCARLGSRE